MTTPNGPAGDPLPEAMMLVQGASEAGYRLKILGGMGVRVLCPEFPPRQRAGQDIDVADDVVLCSLRQGQVVAQQVEHDIAQRRDVLHVEVLDQEVVETARDGEHHHHEGQE